MKRFLKRYWDEGVVYLLAFAGSLLSSSLEAFKAPGKVEVDLSWGRVAVAAFLALAAAFASEVIPLALSGEVREAARAGKRKKSNLARRFFVAMLLGLAATKLVDLGTMLPQLGG